MSLNLSPMSLEEFCDAVARPHPAPAGVAVAAVSAAMALSLLRKVLSITGKHANLSDPARQLIQELMSAADDDCAAINNYVVTRDRAGLIDVPLRVVRATVRGRELCAHSCADVTGLISADILAASELLAGAAKAAILCIEQNLQHAHQPTVDAEIASLTQRLQAATIPAAS